MAELSRTGQKQRFNRLQVLLSRSQMYSTYILGRLNARREAEKRRLERMERKKEELADEQKTEEKGKSEKEKEKSEKEKESIDGSEKCEVHYFIFLILCFWNSIIKNCLLFVNNFLTSDVLNG